MARRLAAVMRSRGYDVRSSRRDVNGVSLGYCAQIAGMDKEEFIHYLSENGISVFHFDDKEEFIEEMNNA